MKIFEGHRKNNVKNIVKTYARKIWEDAVSFRNDDQYYNMLEKIETG